MITSAWKCPDCKRTLFITSSACYWCSVCHAEKKVDAVDPMGRDWQRNQIAVQYATEKALYAMGEA